MHNNGCTTQSNAGCGNNMFRETFLESEKVVSPEISTDCEQLL